MEEQVTQFKNVKWKAFKSKYSMKQFSIGKMILLYGGPFEFELFDPLVSMVVADQNNSIKKSEGDKFIIIYTDGPKE